MAGTIKAMVKKKNTCIMYENIKMLQKVSKEIIKQNENIIPSFLLHFKGCCKVSKLLQC